MENKHNFMQLGGPNFGAPCGMELRPGLTFCRQSLGAVFADLALMPLRRLGRALRDRLRVYEGRGAGERVLLPNLWALRPLASPGLLRGRTQAQGFSTATTQAMTGPDQTGAYEAGASVAQRLAGDLQAFTRALLREGGDLPPLQPCMNELPSHAQNLNARLLCPDRLCGASGAGVQKLF